MIRFIIRGKQRKIHFFSIVLVTVITVYTIANNGQGSVGKVNEQERLARHEHKPRRSEVQINTRPFLLLYWSKVFGKPVEINNRKKLPYFYLEESCEQQCELTVNKSRAMEADAIIIHARDPNPFPPEGFFHIPLILHTSENPVYTNLLSNPLFLSHFKYLISYRLDSDFPFPMFMKPTLTPPVPFEQKTGMVFAAFSNCETVRTAYLAQLMKHITVDSYGSCLNNKHGLPQRYQKDFKKKKTELSRYYKFTLVFMNADCEYFVDDQLTHALSAGSIPIFMGTDKVESFLPGNLKSSIIKVKDFKSPTELAKYLTYLSSNEREYSKYLKWKYDGFQLPANYTSTPIGQVWDSSNTIYCKICQRLSQNHVAKQRVLKADMCRPRAWKTWFPQ